MTTESTRTIKNIVIPDDFITKALFAHAIVAVCFALNLVTIGVYTYRGKAFCPFIDYVLLPNIVCGLITAFCTFDAIRNALIANNVRKQIKSQLEVQK